MAEPIDAIWGTNSGGPRNHVLDGGLNASGARANRGIS